MPSQEQLQSLANSLSERSRIVTDEQSSKFQECLLRWSDIGRRTPGAVVLPSSEEDCQTTVRWAVSNKVAFVAKSGGMSLYSTIGKEGIIIDLTGFASVVHNKTRHEAVLKGGITSKAVAVELAKDGHCTTLPSSNPVGAIPFFLNGGNSPLVSKLGYGSDNIISARMVTATGELINVSDAENKDLLYAIRGAGQFFGLVTSLTVRSYPVEEVFGNSEGSFWSGRFVFPLERVEEVARAMESIVNDDKYCIGGMIMVGTFPPAFQPAIAVTAKVIHPESDSMQAIAFKQLYDLKPTIAAGGQIPIENNADALQPLSAPGGFKKLRLTGIQSYNPKHMIELAALWQDLTVECPGARSTVFGILFESQETPVTVESANGMHHIRIWANMLMWCQQENEVEVIERYLDRAIDITRTNQSEDSYVDFANSLREPESRMEHRYRSATRLTRLQELKSQWDPKQVFSSELA